MEPATGREGMNAYRIEAHARDVGEDAGRETDQSGREERTHRRRRERVLRAATGAGRRVPSRGIDTEMRFLLRRACRTLRPRRRAIAADGLGVGVPAHAGPCEHSVRRYDFAQMAAPRRIAIASA